MALGCQPLSPPTGRARRPLGIRRPSTRRKALLSVDASYCVKAGPTHRQLATRVAVLVCSTCPVRSYTPCLAAFPPWPGGSLGLAVWNWDSQLRSRPAAARCLLSMYTRVWPQSRSSRPSGRRSSSGERPRDPRACAARLFSPGKFHHEASDIRQESITCARGSAVSSDRRDCAPRERWLGIDRLVGKR